MHTFKNTEGREWKLSLDVASADKVKAACQVDLIDLKDSPLGRLADDPRLLVRVLWVLCEEQAETAQITPEQFGRGFAGDVLDDAVTALVEEIADFFPRSKRPMLQMAVAKTREAQRVAVEMATAKIERLDVNALVAQKFAAAPGSSPERSA